jgi:flagellar hook-basal body complex protein FliE
MDISKLASILGGKKEVPGLDSTSGISSGVPETKGPSFGKVIENSMKAVNHELVDSSRMSDEFLTQGKHDMHEVMIALERADLSFRYMTQIRNKVLDAYNEVIRTQV